MHKAFLIVLFCGLLLAFPTLAKAETITIPAIRYCNAWFSVFDEWGNPSAPEANVNDCPQDVALWTGASYESGAVHPYTIARPLIQFDTSSIPTNATISSAQLNFYYDANQGYNLNSDDSGIVWVRKLANQYTESLTGSSIEDVTSTTLSSLSYDANISHGWHTFTIDSNYLSDINAIGHTYISYALSHNQDFQSTAPEGMNDLIFVSEEWTDYEQPGAIWDVQDQYWYFDKTPTMQVTYN